MRERSIRLVPIWLWIIVGLLFMLTGAQESQVRRHKIRSHAQIQDVLDQCMNEMEINVKKWEANYGEGLVLSHR